MRICVLAAVFASTLVTAEGPTATGTWEIKSEVMGNAGEEVCTLTQDGARIAGSCTGQDNAKRDVTGEVSGEKVTFRHDGDYEGQTLTITYTGKFETGTVLSGEVSVAPFNVEGTFKATKK